MSAASKKEERNERIVRGLLKLPPNRRCINCNALGPQYVCTSFWTFICISCSGIHREFTHRVKSVSMSKFTVREVEALQKGGNQRARESLLKDFDTQQMRLPDSSNIGSLREFIRVVYVEKRYDGVSFSERPPRDKQIQKSHEEEHRRASSYHSFAQSPPNDYQYEETRNGKQPAMLSRKPGSDGGHDGKMSGFSYCSHSLQERMSEDQFENDMRGSRTSDCSGSSVSDAFRTASETPNFFDNGCFSPRVQQNQANMLNSNGITQSQRSASIGNIDSKSQSGNSSLTDLFFDSENVHGTQESNNSVAPSFVAFYDAVNGAEVDLFSRSHLQQQHATGLYPSVDFFANMPPTTPSADNMPLEAPSMDNAGWATFDTPPKDKQHGVIGPSLIASIGNKQTRDHDLFLFEPSDRPTSFLPSKDKVSVSNQSGATSHDTSCSQPWSIYDGTTGGTQSLTGDVSLMTSNLQEHKEANNYQIWHSFDDATGVMTNDHFTAEPLSNDHKNVINVSPTRSNPFTCTVASKQSHDDSHNVFMDELAPSAPFAAFLEPSPTSSLPSLERTSADQVVLNPFDLPFDTVSETLDLIMDMSTLQAGLPNLPSSFIDGLPESWFSNNTSTYVPSGSHGGLSCFVEQVPNSPLRNLPLSTVSTGNPFA